MESEAAPVAVGSSSLEDDNDDDDYVESMSQTKEQQELADFVNTYLGRGTELEDYVIFYVRCRVSYSLSISSFDPLTPFLSARPRICHCPAYPMGLS